MEPRGKVETAESGDIGESGIIGGSGDRGKW